MASRNLISRARNAVAPASKNIARLVSTLQKIDGIPATGRAAQVTKHGGKLSVVNVPVKMPGEGEVLIHICGSGCCHTDIHAVDGDWPVKSILPLTPGHEGVGNVVAVGPGVTSHKLGDKVGVAWLFSACGSCEYCVSGWETLCTQQVNSGFGAQGTMQDYQIAKASHALKLPQNFGIENARKFVLTIYHKRQFHIII